MADHSHIEWTEATWNPVTGCTKISAGCKNCYAERLALRLRAMGNQRYRRGFRVTLHEDVLDLRDLKRNLETTKPGKEKSGIPSWLPGFQINPRELDERFVSSGRAALVYSPRLPNDGGVSAAYLSGADEAERSGAKAEREASMATECLDGCERGR